MEKWVTLGTQLEYRDEQFHEFVKVQQTLEREERHRKREPEREAREKRHHKQCFSLQHG